MLCSTVYITAGNMSPETGKKTPLLHKGLLLDLCSLNAGTGVLYHRLTVAARVCILALLLMYYTHILECQFEHSLHACSFLSRRNTCSSSKR